MCLKIFPNIDTRIRKHFESFETLTAYKVVIFDNIELKYISPIMDFTWKAGWNEAVDFDQKTKYKLPLNQAPCIYNGIHLFLDKPEAERVAGLVGGQVLEVIGHKEDFVGAGVHECAYWIGKDDFTWIEVNCAASPSIVFKKVWVETDAFEKLAADFSEPEPTTTS